MTRAVERRQIPSGPYQAVLIDEGNDFRPEWLQLVTQMVDPATNSLLLLYDDAQSIDERRTSRQFSFKSVGSQAQGRATILKINDRNTKQILKVPSLVAADLLTWRDEAWAIADHLHAAHQEGHAWGDMAILCRDDPTMGACAAALCGKGVPMQVRKKSGDFRPSHDSVKVMTMKVNKGLEFPVVALSGVRLMPAAGEDESEEARLFHVTATRATQRLVIGVSGREGLEVG